MLTEIKLKALRPRDTLYRVADRHGLCIEVPTSGAMRWRFRYRHQGNARMLSLGLYPEVSLASARARLGHARALLAQGIDPSTARKQEKEAPVLAAQEAAQTADATFEAVGRAWMATQNVAEITANKNRWLLETFLFPKLGHRPVDEITPRELLTVLRDVERTGKHETASRAKNKAGQVFRFAIIEGKAELDPTASLRGALKSAQVKHHAAVTDPKQIGELLRAIDGFAGQSTTQLALKFAPLVFVRPNELRKAEWSEFDLDGAIWRIPKERMKMKAPHLVPLSTQAVDVLKELQELTGNGRYLFPSVRSSFSPMSENTINAALRRLGYASDEMTGHGFRSMAATRLNELGWRADAIERQLAHAESNKVREAYTSAAQYLDERTKMMQAWSDYLDGLRAGANVVPLRRAS